MSNNLTLKRGDTWRAVFTWTQGDDPVDLTGCTARLMVRARRADELLLDLTSPDGGLTLTPLTGVVTVLATAAQTATLPVGTHVFDLELTYPDGSVQSTETAFLTVLEDVTHD